MSPAVISLVIAAVFLILGLVILQGFNDTNIVSSGASGTGTNESIIALTEVLQPLAVSATPACRSALTLVINGTGGEAIDLANFTISSCSVAFALGSGGEYNNSNVNVSYTYSGGDEAFVGSNLTIVGLGTFADFWEIIVLAIVISVVIGLLLVVFAGRGAR